MYSTYYILITLFHFNVNMSTLKTKCTHVQVSIHKFHEIKLLKVLVPILYSIFKKLQYIC